MSSFRALAASVALFLAASGADAATLDVSGGQLLGAFGVTVDGALYDVAFVDGSCIDLFAGCAVFDFSSSGAQRAAEALLAQVFILSFDLDPETTSGCESFTLCNILTPYAVGGGFAISWTVENSFDEGQDAVVSSGLAPDTDTGPFSNVVYAQWTAAPEPAVLLLLGTSMLGLARASSRA